MPNKHARPKSPFLIGIIGGQDLAPNDRELLKERMKILLRFLKFGGSPRQLEAPPHSKESSPRFESQETANLRVNTFVELFWQERVDHKLQKVLKQVFRHWKGLPNTPIVVQSGLAPGASSLLADVALEEFKDCEIFVRAPLPLDQDLYVHTPTFVRANPDAFGMRVPDEEDLVRQRDFFNLCERIQASNGPPGNPCSPLPDDDRIYTVHLKRDRNSSLDGPTFREWTRNEVHDRLALELDDPKKLLERHIAAADHLAITSHLLITICDTADDPSTEVVSIIEEARLSGRHSDILATLQSLQMPHGGPLLVLWDRGDISASPTPTNGPEADFRFPFSPHPRVVPANGRADHQHAKQEKFDHHYEQWLLEQTAKFRRTADNLERFNAMSVTYEETYESHFQLLTSYREPVAPHAADAAEVDRKKKHVHLFDKSVELAPEETHFANKLRRVAAMYQTADAQSTQARMEGSALVSMFRWTLFAAVLWHVFCHWHFEQADLDSPTYAVADQAQKADCGEAEGQIAAKPVPHDPEQKSQVSNDRQQHGNHQHSPIRSWCGGFALLIAVLTLLFFVRKNSLQHDEQEHDYRAIAEGLRVQFYWNLAGLGESVSANYMHRQRSELDWIRAVVRGVSLPYGQWRDAFEELTAGFKLRVLKTVKACWVVDQRDYYQRAFKKHHLSLHAWHSLGKILALAGVLCGAYWWAGDLFRENDHDSPAWMRNLLEWWPLLLFMVLTQYLYNLCNDSHSDQLPKRPEEWWMIPMHTLIGGHGSDVAPDADPRRLVKKAFVDFAWYVVPTMFLSFMVLFLCEHAVTFPKHCPNPHNLGIITTGALLLSGALASAWAEKKFYSELSYQYQTMYALFRHAATHIDRELAALEGLIETNTARDPVEFNKQIKELQQFLFALGKEALDENAEWLLLHRARPLEPVMAG